MGLKQKLGAIFILLRPYSLPGLFLLYYLAKVIVTHSLAINAKTILEFIPIFFAWTYFVLLLEAQHKHSNREKIPYSYPIISLAITAISAIIFGGIAPIIPLAAFVLLTYAYTKKTRIPLLGSLSFIVRGLAETSLFFLSLSILSTNYLQIPTIIFGLVILLITSARNLIGDIRDTKFDEMTFSVRFGNPMGYLVSIFLYIIGGYLLFNLSYWSLVAIFPLILMTVCLLMVDNGYILHRLAVILSSIIMATYILLISGNSILIFLLNIVFLAVLSNLLFYNLVPRRSNPIDIPTKFGIAPWLNASRHNRNNKTKDGARF